MIPFTSLKCRLTSPFNNRKLNGKSEFHSGYDLVGIGSSTVINIIAGTVVQSRMITDKKNKTWEWGNYVAVQSESGYIVYYCHLKYRAVVVGQKIKVGDIIGEMGNTGYSFGAHLHIEVRKDGKTISPEELTGIPNKIGVYKDDNDDLELAIKTFVKAGIIQTPEYWITHISQLEYLRDLFIKTALVLRGYMKDE